MHQLFMFLLLLVMTIYHIQGDKLHGLLLQHGCMEKVNVKFEREHLQQHDEDLQGGWHTAGSLKLLPGWDE